MLVYLCIRCFSTVPGIRIVKNLAHTFTTPVLHIVVQPSNSTVGLFEWQRWYHWQSLCSLTCLCNSVELDRTFETHKVYGYIFCFSNSDMSFFSPEGSRPCNEL